MGWWKLVIESVHEIDDCDREHIADLIKEGYTEGEICTPKAEPV